MRARPLLKELQIFAPLRDAAVPLGVLSCVLFVLKSLAYFSLGFPSKIQPFNLRPHQLTIVGFPIPCVLVIIDALISAPTTIPRLGITAHQQVIFSLIENGCCFPFLWAIIGPSQLPRCSLSTQADEANCGASFLRLVVKIADLYC